MRERLVKFELPTKDGDMLGAKGNSGDMVIKVVVRIIDAAKYLSRIRYGLND